MLPKWGRLWTILVVFLAVFLGSVKSAEAIQYQQCPTDSTCVVGEFLYDDDYQPISVGTTCTLTSRHPDGTLLLNAVDMPATADGWYAYSVGTSGLSNGVYRSQMCCITGTDNMCLDKTFEIATTLSSLAADIWSYPSRSLNSFADLVTGIWSGSNRSLTSSVLDDGSSLATTTDTEMIGSTLATLAVQVSTVQTTVITIDSKVDALQSTVNSIQTSTNNILNKWGSYSVTDILNYVDGVETELGNNTDTCSDETVFGQVQCLIDKWGMETAGGIYSAANNAYTTITSVRSELGFNGKSTTAYDQVIAIKAYVDTIESSIGSSADTSAISSIFGRIKQVKEAVDDIDSTTLDLDDLLGKWGDLSASDIYDKVKNLSSEVAAINTVSNVNSILSIGNTTVSDLTQLKNQTVAMKALLDLNRILLETINNKPVIKSWLEEGSIIFKNLATNPSSLIKQKVEFEYYFPPEVKESHIIKKSDGLEIKYDATLGAYYASGEFELGPKESIFLDIEVEDIWSVSVEKIESLRMQASELYEPLKKTSYFAQGATLYSDIIASLDRVMEIQKRGLTPEDRIKAYREAMIEFESAVRKLDDMKSIVSSAGSIGTLSGFIGGVQTLAVWGIVVVLVAGFVFLGLYIRSLDAKNGGKKERISTTTDDVPREKVVSRPKAKKREVSKGIRYMAIFVTMSLSSGVSAVAFNRLFNRSEGVEKTVPTVLSAQTTMVPTETVSVLPTASPTAVVEVEKEVETETVITTTEPSPSPEVTVTPSISQDQKKVIVVPSINSYVNLRSGPNRNLSLVTKVLSGQELVVIGEKYNDVGEKWLNVNYEGFGGWILAELTQVVENTGYEISARVKINVPDYDVVYLYSRPSFNASVSHKLTESQGAEILVETKRWAKVIMSRINIEGWVSQDFIERDIP